jgi:effector-binding domain-containing protein
MTARLLRLTAAVLLPAFALSFAPAIAQAPPTPATPPAPTAPPPQTPATASPPSPAPTMPGPAPVPATPAPPPAAAENPGVVPPAAQVQVADPFGEETTLTAKTVVIAKGTATWDAAFETLIEAFKSVTAVLDKQSIKPTGNAMIVYTSTDDSGFTFQAEYPVDQEPKNLPKNISIGKSPEGKALKFVHRGSYDNMDNTYEAITNHLDDKKLEAKDTFIEEYLTDPLKTAEDKLVINVFVPLK